jgi:hypothetical protein
MEEVVTTLIDGWVVIKENSLGQFINQYAEKVGYRKEFEAVLR